MLQAAAAAATCQGIPREPLQALGGEEAVPIPHVTCQQHGFLAASSQGSGLVISNTSPPHPSPKRNVLVLADH